MSPDQAVADPSHHVSTLAAPRFLPCRQFSSTANPAVKRRIWVRSRRSSRRAASRSCL